MPFNTRPVEEADFPQLIQLFQEFALFEKTPDRMHNTVERMQAEKEFFNCFVVENSKEEIIAFASYFFCYFTWQGKSLYLDDLYVKPAYRSEGLGSELINRLIQLAKDSGCHRMRWQVSAWNAPAIAFYKKLGAEIDGTESNCDLTF